MKKKKLTVTVERWKSKYGGHFMKIDINGSHEREMARFAIEKLVERVEKKRTWIRWWERLWRN